MAVVIKWLKASLRLTIAISDLSFQQTKNTLTKGSDKIFVR